MQVFICEQKLYTRSQLQQHVRSGDSEVDGTEEERSGFAGHPMCEFCKSPFYGDNELYMHMSTEHYTCHICQRYSVVLSCGMFLLQCSAFMRSSRNALLFMLALEVCRSPI